MRCLHGETGRFCRQCVDELEQKCGCDPPTPSPEEDCGHPVQMRYESGYGTVVCMYCGIESPGGSLCVDASYMYPRGYEITVSRKQPYTRAKRFRKYLMRACMSQGLSSVPDSTWKYLQDHGPYSGPRYFAKAQAVEAEQQVLRQSPDYDEVHVPTHARAHHVALGGKARGRGVCGNRDAIPQKC